MKILRNESPTDLRPRRLLLLASRVVLACIHALTRVVFRSQNKTIVFVALIVILSFFSWRSLLKPGYFSMHDDMQDMRIFQMDKCIKDGQIPCRWVPDLGYGYGYPLFNYYPPLPYYLGEAFHLTGFSLINSVKILFGLGLVLSGIFMYFLAREFWGDWGGFLSAIFYIYAPYHAVDLYVRGAMNEHWALVWFPLILLFVYKLILEDRKKWLVLLAVSYGFLLLTHNVMTMVFSPVALAWGLLWLVKTKNYRRVFKLIAGVIWGVGLSAFFLFPVLLEKKFAHTETMFMGYFNYLAHFVTLHQLFISTAWGWGASVYGPIEKMPFMIGFSHWGLMIMNFLIAVFLWRKKKDSKFLLVMTFLTIFFLGSAFLTHERSTPVWLKIKPLEYLQFPWRFLGLVIFFASFAAGLFMTVIKSAKLKLVLSAILCLGLIFSVKDYFRPETYYPIKDKDRLTGKQWQLALTNAIFDYLPVYAQYPPAEEAPKLPQIVEGKGEIDNFQKGTNWQNFQISASGEKTAVVRLSLYDFPGWTVLVNNQKVVTDHNNFLGLITFEVPAGKSQITVKMRNTPIRSFANGLSLMAWGLLAANLLKNKKKTDVKVKKRTIS